MGANDHADLFKVLASYGCTPSKEQRQQGQETAKKNQEELNEIMQHT